MKITKPYHYNPSNQYQCMVLGKKGHYIIRQYDKEWWAIQLFGLVGCISGKGKTPEDAFNNAEKGI